MATSLESYLEQHYAKKKKDTKLEKKNEITQITHNNVSEQIDNGDMKKSVKKDTENKKEISDKSGHWIDVQSNLPVQNAVDSFVDNANEKHGGLQTNAQLRKETREKEIIFKKEKEILQKLSKNDNLVNKTIYRDSSGRKLKNSEVKEFENAKRQKTKSNDEVNEEIRYRNRNEAGILQEQEMREKLKNFKNEGINVYENDEKLIKKQKEQILEEDPALLFSKKVIKRFEEDNKNKEFTSISGRKLYSEVNRYPLNRFKIKPGWRWDGIVRGNGFEQNWFNAQKK